MLSFRQLQSDDLPLAIECVKTYFAHDDLTFGDHVSTAIAELLEDPTLGRFWSLEDGQEQVGYLVLTFGFDHEFGGRIGLITDFYLRDTARNRGLGTQAITLAQSEAKSLGLKAIELYVLDHNAKAKSFYHRAGFTQVKGRSPMSKQLD